MNGDGSRVSGYRPHFYVYIFKSLRYNDLRLVARKGAYGGATKGL